MRLFRKKKDEELKELDIMIQELKLKGCPLCRPVARGAAVTKTFHLPNKDTVEMEILDERINPNRKCLTLCVMDDPQMGWVEAPIRFCPRCGTDLLDLIRQNKNA